MKFLIIYGTGEGQTRKISRFIEGILEEEGHQATIADATEEPPSAEEYEAILIGSSIHMHRYHDAVKDYIMQNLKELNNKPSVFFSVCMAVASDIEEEHEEARKIAADFLEYTGWKTQNIWHIAGALKYTRYDYFKRLIMRMIAQKQGGSTDTSRDHEYTDWEELRKNVLTFLKQLQVYESQPGHSTLT